MSTNGSTVFEEQSRHVLRNNARRCLCRTTMVRNYVRRDVDTRSATQLKSQSGVQTSCPFPYKTCTGCHCFCLAFCEKLSCLVRDILMYFCLYFKYICLLCTCTLSTFFCEYFYFYLSSFFSCYLYFYSSTENMYLSRHRSVTTEFG